MFYHNSSQSFARPGITVGRRQVLVRRSTRELFGSTLFWRTLGRNVGVILAVALVITSGFVLYGGHLARLAAGVTSTQHQMIDNNIALRAERARILAPQAIETSAGEALSLYSPKEDQYFVYNNGKGRFDKL